jgi:hypothetical protein
MIEGKPYQWSELVRLRHEQLDALRTHEHQPTLFELKQDVRPAAERKAADRYAQPSLFTSLPCLPQ